MNLSTRIRQARARAGLSIRDLAALLNLSHAAVGHWETGAHVPSIVALLKVAEITKVDIAWLVSGQGQILSLRELTGQDELDSIGGGLIEGIRPASFMWAGLHGAKLA